MLKHRRNIAEINCFISAFWTRNQNIFLLKKHHKFIENYLSNNGTFRYNKNRIIGLAQTSVLLLLFIVTEFSQWWFLCFILISNKKLALCLNNLCRQEWLLSSQFCHQSSESFYYTCIWARLPVERLSLLIYC